MVPGFKLHLNNQKNIETELDTLFSQLKGVFFANCITPAPDTPRSMASFFTSVYPKDHGCEFRSMWPGYFLNQIYPSIFQTLGSNGYKGYAKLTDHLFSRNALIPKDAVDTIEFFDSLASIGKAVTCDSQEKQYVFIQDMDYHYEIDQRHSDKSAHIAGCNRISNSISSFLQFVGHDYFDCVFIFSDHGCKFSQDKKSTLSLLDEDRTNTMLFMHRKSDTSLVIDNNLRSIMDIYPTILNLSNIDKSPTYHEGHSLLQSWPDRQLSIEDHGNFTMSIGDRHRLWGYRSELYQYIEAVSGEYCFINRRGHKQNESKDHQLSTEVRSLIRRFIRTNSSSFAEFEDESESTLEMQGLAGPKIFQNASIVNTRRNLFYIRFFIVKMFYEIKSKL